MERIGLACGRVDNHWRGAFDTPSLAFARGNKPALSTGGADWRHALRIAWTSRCFRTSDWDGVCRYFLIRTLLTPAIATKPSRWIASFFRLVGLLLLVSGVL